MVVVGSEWVVHVSESWSRLSEAVAYLSERGTLGVTALGPDGSRWSHNGRRRFRAASTVKIPIMIEIFRQIDAGTLSLDDPYELVDDDRTGGSGVLMHMSAGCRITRADLLYLMISISDNQATNVLIRDAGIERVNATMHDVGMSRSNLGRIMRGRPAQGDEQENFSTSDDYVTAVQGILDGSVASAASCEAMTKLLEQQQNHRRIARHLPNDRELRFGSKTGSNQGVANDVGFVMGPNGRLIIAVYTEGFVDSVTAEAAIGEVARAAMIDTGVASPTFTS